MKDVLSKIVQEINNTPILEVEDMSVDELVEHCKDVEDTMEEILALIEEYEQNVDK